jgi:hypothetical protein
VVNQLPTREVEEIESLIQPTRTPLHDKHLPEIVQKVGI